jgi:hypothetical protein
VIRIVSYGGLCGNAVSGVLVVVPCTGASFHVKHQRAEPVVLFHVKQSWAMMDPLSTLHIEDTR